MGNKIKERREALGLGQYELARASGVSRGTIWALETNSNYATTTKTLAKIAKALHTTIGEIFLPIVFNN